MERSPGPLLEGLQQRWSKPTDDLTKLPLKDLIGPFNGPGQSAVVLNFDDGIDVGQ